MSFILKMMTLIERTLLTQLLESNLGSFVVVVYLVQCCVVNHFLHSKHYRLFHEYLHLMIIELRVLIHFCYNWLVLLLHLREGVMFLELYLLGYYRIYLSIKSRLWLPFLFALYKSLVISGIINLFARQ